MPDEEFGFLSLPDGMTAESLNALITTAEAGAGTEGPAPAPSPAAAPSPAPVESAPAPAAAPSAPVAESPAGAVQVGPQVPVAVLQKERRKTRALREEYERIREENDSLKAQQARAAATAPRQIVLKPAAFAPAVRESVKRRFFEQDGKDLPEDYREPVGKLVDNVFTALEGEINRIRQEDAQVIGQATAPVNTAQADLDANEQAFAREHEDYYQVLHEAKFLGPEGELMADPRTSRPRNEVLHQRIFGAARPWEKAYALAKAKLAPDADDDLPAVAAAATAASAAPVALAAPVAAAQRSAAPAPVPASTAGDRGRGFRSVPGSGGAPPRVTASGAALRALMHTNYPAFQELMTRNPDVEYRLFSGDLAGT